MNSDSGGVGQRVSQAQGSRVSHTVVKRSISVAQSTVAQSSMAQSAVAQSAVSQTSIAQSQKATFFFLFLTGGGDGQDGNNTDLKQGVLFGVDLFSGGLTKNFMVFELSGLVNAQSMCDVD
mgnify:FL=1